MRITYLLYALIALLVVTRFLFLDKMPIFSDEAQNLYLADETLRNPLLAFNSTSYGVFPVTIFILAFLQFITFKVFNPLILGRIAVTSFDIISALLVFLITRRILDSKFAILAPILYLILPLNVLHGRVVLLESLTNLFTLLLIFLSLKWFQDKKLAKVNQLWITITAAVLILSFFTKPLAAVSYPALLLIPLGNIKNGFKKVYLNLFLMFLIGGVITLLLYIPASGEFNGRYVSETNSLDSILDNSLLNFRKFIIWSNIYFTLPILIATILSAVLIVLKRNYKLFWILGWLMLIVVISLVLAKGFYPRHLYTLSAPIALLCTFLFTQLKFSKFTVPIVLATLVVLPIKQDFDLTTNPKHALLASEDRQQFFEDWTSGEGHQEVAGYINKLSQNEDVVVYIEDSPYQYWEFKRLFNVGRAQLIPSKELRSGQFINIDSAPQDKIVLVIISQPIDTSSYPVEKSFSYPKGPNDSIDTYKLIRN